MKTTKSHALSGMLLLFVAATAWGQSPCPSDSLPLNVNVTTDAWGYELYWELIEASAECGDGSALLWGGNSEVGCGDGVEGLASETYGNNLFYASPTICVSEEDSLVLVHRDSYGDGGTQFTVVLGGEEAFGYAGTGSGNDWAFQPVVAQSDLPCLAESIFADSVSWVGSTVDATVTPSEPAPPGLGCGTFGGWCESGLSNTIWLSWEVPAQGGVFEITTCNEQTTFDTQLALWQVADCGDFDSYQLVNANDDAGCGFGAYRSTLLTPCLTGGEMLMLQVDGYYGEVGTVEVSITSTSPEAWSFGAGVQDLTCNLQTAFNPNGAIGVNTNVGSNAVSWSWNGPFGFTSESANIGPLLPGVYELEASFCGQTIFETYEVEEPEPLDLEVSLSPNCELGSTSGSVNIVGGTGEAQATWSSGSFGTTGLDVSGLPGGLFEVAVVDENGCEASETVWVETVGVPEVDLGSDQFGCAGDAFTLLAPIGAGLSYAWTTGQTGALALVQTDAPGTLVVGVEVTDEWGCSATDSVILTLQDCTSSVQDEASEDDVMAFPNPFTDRIQVQLPPGLEAEDMVLMDVSGREVACDWSSTNGVFKAQVDAPAGVYVLSFGPGLDPVRLIKQ